MSGLSDLLDRLGGVYLLPLIIALVAFGLIGAPSSWLTLTVAGLTLRLEDRGGGIGAVTLSLNGSDASDALAELCSDVG